MAKTALITGGGRGIGRAIALAFAREGIRIVVAARTAEQIEQVAREIGNNALAVVCDVSDSQSVARMFSEVGDIDILVNNAGIAESATIVN
ncbi:MAG TPA: SDR family NAD(P)-dependent oxidoreductase, partial [Pyrinomonadaceae bacterium]